MPDEVLRRQMMHSIHLRKRQRPAHIPTTTLPERTVPPLNMGCLAAVLAHRLVPSGLKDLRISRPKIAVGRTPTIARRDALEQPTARRFAAIPDDIGHHLTRSATQRHPKPALLCLRTDETVEFVKFKNIIRLGRHQRVAQGRQLLGQVLQEQQHRAQGDAEDAGDATQADTFEQGFFHKAIQVTIAFRNQHACFSAVMAEAALLAVGGVAVFDDIGALAGRAPVYDAGGNHGSEEVE